MRAARARFGETVSVLHSELSSGERHDQWWRIRQAEARVVDRRDERIVVSGQVITARVTFSPR